MNKLAKLDLVGLYRSGKRKVTVDGVEFKLQRGGPDNNFITASPAKDDRLTPVVNRIYSERVEGKRTADKLARRHFDAKDIPFRIKKAMKSRGR